MQLAAIQLYQLTNNKEYLEDAIQFGKQEPITPWMGTDTAKHYEWYPFINLGHYWLAENQLNEEKDLFILYLRKGIESVYQRGKDNPFNIGIPFIWCSNNLWFIGVGLEQLKTKPSTCTSFNIINFCTA